MSPNLSPESSYSKQPIVLFPPLKKETECFHPQSFDQSPVLYSFPPNKDTLGGIAYFLRGKEENVLVDCPKWNEHHLSFLEQQGGVDWLVLTHRDGISNVKKIKEALNCQVLIQEQEAYLIPEVSVIPFDQNYIFSAELEMIWTPGYSPGSACLYYSPLGGILFSGRHLLPNTNGQLALLKTAKTFHYPRQLRSLVRLIHRLNPSTLKYICPGANIGFLRGQGWVTDAYGQMLEIKNELEEITF